MPTRYRKKGEYTPDEATVSAAYDPAPHLRVRNPWHPAAQAAFGGRVVRLVLCRGKAARLSPDQARRLAAELTAAADQADTAAAPSEGRA
jgi:hypothetical protein